MGQSSAAGPVLSLAAFLAAGLIGLPAAAKEHLVEVTRSEMGDYKVELRIASGKFKGWLRDDAGQRHRGASIHDRGGGIR